MNALPDELVRRRMRCEALMAGLALQLETLRDSLDDGRTDDASRQAREADLALRELAALMLLPRAVEGLDPRWSDPASLQAFRRTAQDALERLNARYGALCAGPWQDAGDMLGRDAAKRLLLRAGAALLAATFVFGGWWTWQEARQARLAAELDRARAERALEAARLVARTWAQAAKATGLAPAVLAGLRNFDACTGTGAGQGAARDLRGAAPDDPCRLAWKSARDALFAAAVPPPGNTDPTPSEVERDPWGSPYVLQADPQGGGRVVSPGPDGRLGTPDDIAEPLP